MINFDRLETDRTSLKKEFESNQPFPFLAIDNLCYPDRLSALVNQIPDPVVEKIGQSRDYVFAKNKFEKSKFRGLGPFFEEIYQDLVSPRFQEFIRDVTSEAVFIDPDFHGGGLHQGGAGSFLDMHADFNYHPLHNTWFRNLNILLYLNRDWQKSYGGELKLRHLNGDGGTAYVEPLFNRCVIMPTRDYTLHGYDKINFPEGAYRRSLATYAYTLMEKPVEKEARSTVWYPEHGGLSKRLLGRQWPKLVKIKTAILGSGTSKNN